MALVIKHHTSVFPNAYEIVFAHCFVFVYDEVIKLSICPSRRCPSFIKSICKLLQFSFIIIPGFTLVYSRMCVYTSEVLMGAYFERWVLLLCPAKWHIKSLKSFNFVILLPNKNCLSHTRSKSLWFGIFEQSVLIFLIKMKNVVQKIMNII